MRASQRFAPRRSLSRERRAAQSAICRGPLRGHPFGIRIQGGEVIVGEIGYRDHIVFPWLPAML
jgi:hypothetical protein